MKLFRNRKFAVLLTVVVVVLSVLLGTGRSVRALRNEALVYFETGANGVNSVQNDLNASAATAANLCTVAERYLPGSEALSALKKRLDPAPVNYSEHLELYDTATGLIHELQREALSEQDAKYVSGFATELESRLYGIQHDPYNQMAASFNAKLRALPVSLLRPVLFIDDLDVFF